jgi:superfamily II DNA or RNA helicase
MLGNLREWQREALDSWTSAGQRGCLEVATGGGKTFFALAARQAFLARKPDGRVLVVVPTTALLDQWVVTFLDDAGIPMEDIKILRGKDLVPDAPINLVVLNTARRFNQTLQGSESLMFVVDECHRAGSPRNSLALVKGCAAYLGLSATPEREYDQGFDLLVTPVLGPILFRYSLEEAIRDGVLAPLRIRNVRIPLLPSEQEEYDELTRRIGRSVALGNEEATEALLRKRARVSNGAAYRLPTAVALLDQYRGRRALMFVESIEAAESLTGLLDERGHSCAVYHSQMGTGTRISNLRGFRRGVFDVLVACRALDEGFNVPEAEMAIVVAGTASRRQRTQRVGRVLRAIAGKDSGEVITLYATSIEQERLLSEASSIGAQAEVRWTEVASG